MAAPALIVLVKFRSALSLEEVMEVAAERIDAFRALGGLTQKYYLHDPAEGELAGLYLWESREAFDAFGASELRASIPGAYQIVGDPRIEVFEVMEVLREGGG